MPAVPRRRCARTASTRKDMCKSCIDKANDATTAEAAPRRKRSPRHRGPHVPQLPHAARRRALLRRMRLRHGQHAQDLPGLRRGAGAYRALLHRLRPQFRATASGTTRTTRTACHDRRLSAAEAAVRAGDPHQALASLTAAVKVRPADPKLRVFPRATAVRARPRGSAHTQLNVVADLNRRRSRCARWSATRCVASCFARRCSRPALAHGVRAARALAGAPHRVLAAIGAGPPRAGRTLAGQRAFDEAPPPRGRIDGEPIGGSPMPTRAWARARGDGQRPLLLDSLPAPGARELPSRPPTCATASGCRHRWNSPMAARWSR
jgi:hypothetical protein